MTHAQRVQLLRSILAHVDDAGRALDTVRAVLDGATLDELAARTLNPTALADVAGGRP